MRRRQAKAQTALIVVIDADTATVEYRLGQLEESVRHGETKFVDPDTEQIARLVPRRNLETWVLCLTGESVDEEADYKGTRNDWDPLIPPAAETLNKWTRPNVDLPTRCIPSLRRGVGELLRLNLHS